ncbi:hypothetical protein [Nocardia sp. CC227C]|uniref:DUF6881 domain-containing protein n=1 Tax=Nocardia sp. CC227C TaxID=3044562 RepID=UPI00278BC889|nr:hypothetical protein [Nocardia sp. CC227C]
MARIDETQRLIGRIVEEILRQAPDGWSRMDFSFVAAGNMLRYELELDTDAVPNIDPPGLIKELRHSMFVAGRGTWYTMWLAIESNGSVSASFDFENRPPGGLIGSALEDDLRLYPREVVPDWVREDLEASRALTGSDERSTPLFPGSWRSFSRAVNASSSPFDDPIDRFTIEKEAGKFVPDDTEMRYLKLTYVYSSAVEPMQSYIEIDGEGYENRRVNVFPDGRVENASLYEEGEFTSLSDTRYSELGKSVDGQYMVEEVTPQQFQAEWLVAEA